MYGAQLGGHSGVVKNICPQMIFTKQYLLFQKTEMIEKFTHYKNGEMA